MNLTTMITDVYEDTMLHKKMFCNKLFPLFLAGPGVTIRANCYPNGTVNYSWDSSSLTWRLQIEYLCYNKGTTHEQTVSSTALITYYVHSC